MPTRKATTEAPADTTAAEPERPASVTKTGNLTREPELGFGKEKGTPFCRFGLAVNEPTIPGNWAGEQRTDFYEVTCFGSLAEHAAECLSKGTRVVVTGRPELERYAADDGTERERKRILATALGPDLRWATVEIHRAVKSRPATTVAGDPDF